MRALLQRLLRDCRGSAAVETALVAPVLILMSVGSFQVSQMVARQHELSNGADEAAAMVLAGWTDSTAQRTALSEVVRTSLGLSANEVTVTAKYRCGVATVYVDDSSTCASGTNIASFLRIQLTDQYTPIWSDFGVGSPFTFTVHRMVQVS